MSAFIDITGQRFGRLIALRVTKQKTPPGSGKHWICRCDCGKTTIVPCRKLRSGHTKSCSCFNRDEARRRFTKHGYADTLTYASWKRMIQRCNNPNITHFKYYGGRGITVCKRWRESFPRFLADMGERPSGRTLDRINNNGPYSPNNCRWSTRKEQANNRRPRSY